MSSSNFKPSAKERLEDLRSFLLTVFGPSYRPFGSWELMDWKYFQDHPSWVGTRSYQLTRKGGIAGHAGMAPVCFTFGSESISSAQLIDWAADSSAPGAGIQVFNDCRSLADTVFTLGGSAESRRIFPHLRWLRRVGDMRQYARPLRPMRQVLHSKLTWKSPARGIRNLLWKLYPSQAETGAWSCRQIHRFEQVWQMSDTVPVVKRTSEWLNYLLSCPAAKMEGYLFLRNREPAGHLLLSRVGPQARIVDLVIKAEEKSDWVRAVSAATRQAAADPETLEIAAASSLPSFCEALEASGFRSRALVPVYLSDGQTKLQGAPLVEITLAIGDEFYASDPDWPMWT